mmetsp:Transcript_4081/g.7156  ORF Transcript_4081/g.7156 Transcript_4081/m.7156 type:complete len:289 (+) Transcript_4081:79-945(+)
MSQEEKAREFVYKADKKLQSFQFFGNSKYEDAADLYAKGANLFKVAKNWQQAGNAFVHQAECFLKLKNQHEAATAYADAALCFKKCSVPDAVNCYRQAIEIFVDMGRFPQAAKFEKEIAQLYEEENNVEDAIGAYQQAADYYQGEDSTSAANQCLLQVAQLSAQVNKFKEAIKIFEQCAETALNNNLLKWSAKEYLLKAGLCVLALNDMDAAKRAVQRYKTMDMSFDGSRECKLLEDIIGSFDEVDEQQFTDVVYEFDQITKLDAWKTSLLLKIKSNLKAHAEGGSIC